MTAEAVWSWRTWTIGLVFPSYYGMTVMVALGPLTLWIYLWGRE